MRVARIAALIVLWTCFVALLLFMSALLALSTRFASDAIASKASSFLSEKTRTNIHIGGVRIMPSGKIALTELFVAGKRSDSLVYFRELDVQVALSSLLHRKIEISAVTLDGFRGSVYRYGKDTVFNYQFIIDAFVPEKKEPATPQTDQKSGWDFLLRKLSVHDLRAVYIDDASGMAMHAAVSDLEVRFDDMAKANALSINEISVNRARVVFRSSRPTVVRNEGPADTSSMKLAASHIALNQCRFEMIDSVSAIFLTAESGNLRIDNASIDTRLQAINANNMSLARARCQLALGESKSDSVPVTDTTVAKPWSVRAGMLALSDCDFTLDQLDAPAVASGVDYSHMHLNAVSLRLTNGHVDGTDIKAHINELAFKERSGFVLNAFSGYAWYSDTGAGIKGLSMTTPQTRLAGDLSVSYDSLGAITRDIRALNAEIKIKESVLGFADALFFVPELRNGKYLALAPAGTATVITDVHGSLNKLSIDAFHLLTAGIDASLRGEIANVIEPSKMFANIPASRIVVNSKIGQLLPVLAGAPLPETADISGSFEGYLVNFNTQAAAITSAGDASLSVRMDPAKGNTKVPYTIHATMSGFSAAALLRDTTLPGPVTGAIDFAGIGKDTSDIDANMNVNITSLVYNRYRYTDIKAGGTLVHSAFAGHAGINDKNIAFEFNGNIDVSNAVPRGTFTFDLAGIALKPLHFSDDDMRLSLNLKADFEVPRKGANPLGSAVVRRLLLLEDDKRFTIDSIAVRSVRTGNTSSVTVQSDIADCSIAGNFRFSSLPASLIHTANSYFRFSPPEKDTASEPQAAKISFELKDPSPLLHGMIPDLHALLPFTFTAGYSNQPRALTAGLSLAQIQYGANAIDSLKLSVDGDASNLKIVTSVASATVAGVNVENLFTSASASDDLLKFSVGTTRDDSTKLFALSGRVKSNYPDYVINFDQPVTIDTRAWAFGAGNSVSITPAGFVVDKLTLRDSIQSLEVQSTRRQPAAPVDMRFVNLNLGDLSSMLGDKQRMVGGTMNGSVQVETEGHFAFRSHLKVDGLSVKGAPWGDLNVRADNYEENGRYAVDVTLKGSGNDMHVSGEYIPDAAAQQLDLSVNIASLQAQPFEALLDSQVTRLAGQISGSLRMRGTTSKPDLRGKLSLHDVFLKPRVIASLLHAPAGDIEFAGDRVRLHDITLLDTTGNKASLAGQVIYSELRNPVLDLHVKTTDFLALNTTKQDNPLYYGRIILNSDITIRGNTGLPRVDLRARLNKGTSVTYVKPETKVMRDESRGIVEFVDPDGVRGRIMQQNDSTIALQAMKGLALNASIQVERDVNIKMIVDPLAGDSLFLKGGGMLNFALDPTGGSELSGKYTINNGGYFLTISDFIKRDFTIQNGSSVTWSGEPLDAYVDLTAVYVTKASPVDLMADQLAGLSELEKNKYRNLLTFNVYLKMHGFISAPEISFDIELAPKDRGAMNGAVNSRLGELRQDENQLNKQVFALLTLRRFVSENPLQSSNDGGIESASRSSASKILTSQLNSFADRYVNFVDLDLGVNSYDDYSTGKQQGRTQVQVGVSKQMFNDRVTVRVGGNVDVEGEKAKQNDANEVAGNISIDYKLTEDGRYKVKAFRENQYENPIEGELTKTGAGVVFTRDFNKFKNLFRKPRHGRQHESR